MASIFLTTGKFKKNMFLQIKSQSINHEIIHHKQLNLFKVQTTHCIE